MSLNDFGENKVTVKKAELLAAIVKNREGHRALFIEAQAGYREEVIRVLDETLAEARSGKPFVALKAAALVVPQEHTKDYDRVIRMLEMSTADEISVSEHQFAQYVLDDWGWKAQFMTSNSSYTKSR